MTAALGNLDRRKLSIALALAILIVVALMPIFLDPLSNTLDFGIFALAYIMFALGLNIVVGFAGLLDLGYVAFYAIGAYSIGWFASDHFSKAGGGKGIHIGVSGFTSTLLGIHLNFLLIILAAMFLAALGGTIIGLPTLRLRGDYIAIVTLAFGEIIFTIATNGDAIEIGGYKLTEGQQAISPVDQPQLPGFSQFDSAFSLRGYFWLGLDGRARAPHQSHPARFAARAGVDRAARGRGRRGEHGRAAGQDEAARVRDRRRIGRSGGRLPRLRTTTRSTRTSSSSRSRSLSYR